MNIFVKCWVAFLVVTFAVSVLTMSSVQARVIKREGWNALTDRSPVDIYWRELSSTQRALLWLGLLTFFLTLVVGILTSIYQ